MRLSARPIVRPVIRPLLLLAALAVPLAGCAILESPPQLRGAHVDPDQLKQLTPGVTTRADVLSLLGSPTAHATFDDNSWIYIGEVTQPRIGRIQGVESQDVLVLTFDQGGVLRKARHLNQADGKDVAVVDRATPSPGSQASFMQQLLGNVGRYSPGAAALGGNSGGGVGGTGGGLNMR